MSNTDILKDSNPDKNSNDVIKSRQEEGASFLNDRLSDVIQSRVLKNSGEFYGTLETDKNSTKQTKKIYRISDKSETIDKDVKNRRISLEGNIKKIISKELKESAIDLTRSDDPVFKVLHSSRDTYKKAKSTIRTVKSSAKAVRMTVNVFKYTTGILQKIIFNLFALKGAVSAVIQFFSIAFILAVILSVTAFLGSVTLKNLDFQLAQTYMYITERDAIMTKDLREIKKEADIVHYYLNGYEIDIEDFEFQSDADKFLMYFDAKYGEYVLANISSTVNTPDGFDQISYDNILPEVYDDIDSIHTAMYKPEKKYVDPTKKTIVVPIYNEWGEKTEVVRTKEYSTIEVFIETKDLDTVIVENKLLENDQIQQMEAMNQVGAYTTKTTLSNPFKKDNDDNSDSTDLFYVSDRWGKYLNEDHIDIRNGIYILSVDGSTVKSVMNGIITKREDGVLVITDDEGSYVVMEHLKNIVVNENEKIKAGDRIGKVSGDKLYIEYYLRNVGNTNPTFYLEGAYTGTSVGSGNADTIVQTAVGELGNIGGRKYINWYGASGPHAWCVMFVSWCADQHGYIDSGIIPKYAVVRNMANWYKSRGLWRNRSGYTPKPGDLIIFDWSGDPSDLDHIGIVEKYHNGKVYTIEGNYGNKAVRNVYPVDSKVIIGYCLPNY